MKGDPTNHGDGAVEPRRDLLPGRQGRRRQARTGTARSRPTASWSRRASTSRRSSSSRCARSATPRTRPGRSSRTTPATTCRTRSASTTTTSRPTGSTACVYMEGWQKNKNRLDLAKLLLDEGKKRNEKYAAAQNAYGLYCMHRDALNEALAVVRGRGRARPQVRRGPDQRRPAHAGLPQVRHRQGACSRRSLEIEPKNYEAIIGLGIAMRGLSDLDGAEAQYKKAEAARPAARRGLLQPRRALQGLPGDQAEPIRQGVQASQLTVPAGAGLLQPVPGQGRRGLRQGRGQEQHRGLRQGHQAARQAHHRSLRTCPAAPTPSPAPRPAGRPRPCEESK